MTEAKSKPAVEAEATDEEAVTVEWRDLKFDVPLERDEWPLEATMAIEDGRWTVALRALVPPAQFRAFINTSPKTKDGGELFQVIVSALGFKDAGESPASSD